MYVSITDAQGFAELQERLGVPEATSGMVELFGEYCGGGAASGFWSYDPETKVWSQLGSRCAHELPEFPGIADDERKRFRTAAEYLGDVGRPVLPKDRMTVQRDKPFLYMGFTFQWLFIPELGRWELLPLGRYETATNQR